MVHICVFQLYLNKVELKRRRTTDKKKALQQSENKIYKLLGCEQAKNSSGDSNGAENKNTCCRMLICTTLKNMI